MKKSILTISTLALAISSFHVFAEAKPAVIYDTAGKFDKSFNEAVYQNGVKVMEAEGLEVREFEPQNEA
ncbi:BMP family ABC transporter substrate-binding protein, partial [Vibrio cholerae]